MAEPVPCPNCQTPLLLPAGVSVVACPNCGAELDVEPTEAAGAPPPPAARAKPAPAPLPFARAKPVPPPPEPVASAKPVRAKYVPEPPPAAADPYAGKTASDAEREASRKREVEKKLRELDREERQAERRYERVERECAWGRKACGVLGKACLIEMSVLVCTAAHVALNLFGVEQVGFALIAYGDRVASLSAMGVGFALACFGNRPARPIAQLGLGLTLLAIVTSVVAAVLVAGTTDRAGLVYESNDDRYLLANVPFVNATQSASIVGDFSLYAALGAGPPRGVQMACLVAGAAWFAAVAALGTLSNFYAVGGKDRNLAERGIRFVYYMVGAIVLLSIDTAAVAQLAPVDFRLVAVMLCLAVYLATALLLWFNQSRVFTDIDDVLLPERWLDHRAEL